MSTYREKMQAMTEGQRMAYSCGTEADENRTSRLEYHEDIANAYGKDNWGELTKEQQLEAKKFFNEGRLSNQAARREFGG